MKIIYPDNFSNEDIFNNENTTKKRGLGGEDKIHKDFKRTLEQYEAYSQTNILCWSYIASGEHRNKITANLLKAKGVKRGWGDYLIISDLDNSGIAHAIFLEFKYGKNKQSEYQVDFQKNLEQSQCLNTHYKVCYSTDEAIEYLKQIGVILTS
jgi:hypothetical protein